jgi:hypothetical protein
MRQYYRYAASINCVVEVPGQPSVEGVVTDVSLGGAGLETQADPGGIRGCTLVLSYDGSQVRLPCNIRHRRQLWNRFVLHTKFRRLSEEQHLPSTTIAGWQAPTLRALAWS